MADTYRPPKGVQEEAQRALKWIADGKAGSGFTDTGRARAAQLARGDAVSADTILRMYSYLSRHEVDKQGEGFNPEDDGYPSPGRVAWAAWGGDPGLEWSSRIRDQINARSAILEESHMSLAELRAEGADVPLSDALTMLLGEVFEFYARAHEAHWNVTGPDFSEYHKLFGKIYEDAHDSVDAIAENLRKIGSLTPALALAPCEYRYTDPIALASELLEETTELCDSYRVAFDIATGAGQQGIANFLAERQDAHAMWAWQLRSSLGIAEIGDSPALDAIVIDDAAEVEDDVTETNSADPEVEARRAMVEACEKRNIAAEIRTETRDDGLVGIRGYAAVFGKEADGLPFREMIMPGAFKRSLDNGDECYLLVNHNTEELPLARRSSGTLTLSEDDHGLLMEAVLDPANPRAAEVISVLSREDASEMSFAFTVAPEGSTRTKDGLRELRDLNLFEVSICTWGAYSQTTVGLRSAEADDDLAARWLAKKWDIKRRQHAR